MSASEPYNEDVFRTVLSKAIGIMNRRPLTEITIDPDDFRVLSPNNFLDPLTNDLCFQEVIPHSNVLLFASGSSPETDSFSFGCVG
jgi:hypothetical protein